MSERSSDQSKKINLQDLISKENLTKLVKSMEYETQAIESRYVFVEKFFNCNFMDIVFSELTQCGWDELSTQT